MPSATWAKHLSAQARTSIIAMCGRAGASHVGSSLSVVDVLAAIYAYLGVNTQGFKNATRQTRVILSKGHAAAALYAVLAHAGAFDPEDLVEYCMDGSWFPGHVTYGHIPGVDFSTGSLGHGLPVALGMAIAQQRSGGPGRTFVVLSDGELDEGSVWEAALLASHLRVGNLTVIVDRNRLQSLSGTEETVALEPLASKWTAFGWRVVTVDGHDHDALVRSLEAREMGSVPTVVLAETVKGKGVSFMEDRIEWHYRSPTSKEVEVAVREISGGVADA